LELNINWFFLGDVFVLGESTVVEFDSMGAEWYGTLTIEEGATMNILSSMQFYNESLIQVFQK
jgi:hypothetical protein